MEEDIAAQTLEGKEDAASWSARRDWEALYRDQDTAAEYASRRFGSRTGRLNNRWIWRAVRSELRRAAGGGMPRCVIDAPAGTGRFTAELRDAGVEVVNVDRSPAMLRQLARQHGPGREVVADLRQPALTKQPGAVVLCLRLMQHLGRTDRVAVLRGMRALTDRAVVAYYPGWHLKTFGRRMKHRLGLPHRSLREYLARRDMEAEAAEAGWTLAGTRIVLPLLSENVLLRLEAHL